MRKRTIVNLLYYFELYPKTYACMNDVRVILNNTENGATKIYLIAGILGLALGMFPCFLGGTFNLFLILLFGILGLLIGWGIRNKQLKYKSFALRTLRFLANEKPTYTDLYQKLLPCFNSLNMKMEMNKNGTICIPYNGLFYDVIFNEDDTFSIQWRQSFAKALLRQGYYISIYKKASIAIGIIAYHVQQACLTEKELYYTDEEQ